MELFEVILRQVDEAFASAPRPEHFTDFGHCDECLAHDRLLRSRDRETLQRTDLPEGNDPMCFISPAGFAYYFPALARFAVWEAAAITGPYAPQLLFHLWSGGPYNTFLAAFAPEQRRAVVEFLGYIGHCGSAGVIDHDYLRQAIENWSAAGG